MSDGGTPPADAPAAPTHEIPILTTAGNAYRTVFTDLKHVYLLAWKPFVAAVAVGFVLGFCDSFLRHGPILSGTVGVLVGYWSNAYFALAFHRYQLFGWNETTSQVRFGFGRAERIFVLFATGMYIFYSLLPALIVQKAGTAALGVWLAAGIAVLPIGVGISLVFPAAAAEHPAPVANAWRLSRGIRWRIFGIEVACILPGALLSVVLEPLTKALPVVAPLMLGIVSYPFAAAFIAALCRIFKIKSGTAAPAV